MDLKVFTDGNKNTNSNLTNGENIKEPKTSPNDKQYGNINEDKFLLTPRIYSSLHLVKQEDKVKEYELILKINDNRPFRLYEVENIVIGKPIEYLYKNSILNIIKQRVLNSMPKGIKFDENSLIEDYMNKLSELLNKN